MYLVNLKGSELAVNFCCRNSTGIMDLLCGFERSWCVRGPRPLGMIEIAFFEVLQPTSKLIFVKTWKSTPVVFLSELETFRYTRMGPVGTEF